MNEGKLICDMCGEYHYDCSCPVTATAKYTRAQAQKHYIIALLWVLISCQWVRPGFPLDISVMMVCFHTTLALIALYKSK